MILIFVGLLFISAQFEATNCVKIGREASLVPLLDEVINNLRKNQDLLLINPITLPNITSKIDNSSYWVHFFFEDYALNNGQIMNFTTIQTLEDNVAVYENKTLQLQIGIKFTELKAQFDFVLDSYPSFLSQNGILTIDISDFNIQTTATFDVRNYSIVIDELSFKNTGDIDVDIDAWTISSWIVNRVLGIATKWFENQLLTSLQNILIKVINEYLAGIFV